MPQCFNKVPKYSLLRRKNDTRCANYTSGHSNTFILDEGMAGKHYKYSVHTGPVEPASAAPAHEIKHQVQSHTVEQTFTCLAL